MQKILFNFLTLSVVLKHKPVFFHLLGTTLTVSSSRHNSKQEYTHKNLWDYWPQIWCSGEHLLQNYAVQGLTQHKLKCLCSRQWWNMIWLILSFQGIWWQNTTLSTDLFRVLSRSWHDLGSISKMAWNELSILIIKSKSRTESSPSTLILPSRSEVLCLFSFSGILYWFVWEEGLLAGGRTELDRSDNITKDPLLICLGSLKTDLRNWTLEQTEFLSFVVHCWIP